MIGQAAAPLRRRKDARPRELLSAAMSLFVQKGFAATRTDEIAERAGVSKGTLYLYFDHKEALFTALVAESFFCEFPFESASALEGRQGSAILQDVVTTWRSALVEGPVGGVVKLVFTEVHHFPVLADLWVRRILAPTRAVVHEAVQRGVAEAQFRAVDPELVMNALVLPVIATCLHRHAIGPHLSSTSFDEPGGMPACTLDLLLQGLTNRATAGRTTVFSTCGSPT